MKTLLATKNNIYGNKQNNKYGKFKKIGDEKL